MLKFLLILFFLIFIVFRLSGAFLRILGGGTTQGRTGGNQDRYTRTKNGNVNVDYKPGSKKRKKDFRGGEYVDFEEVK